VKLHCISLTYDLGSSVGVERVLSGGHDVISLRRGSLSAETISALMTARNWIKLAKCLS
jgi:hypothetical protein